ncbi:hypothetical protein HZ994_11650 [Akkermansiaceae bacterium]|nr:hypothetical protein HZ994_11650 [Akkermansiaceae bacterium]
MKHLYHYTRATNLVGILNSGQIHQATAFVNTSREKPVVWLSFHRHWEPTATPMLYDFSPLSFEEFAEVETPIRIEVDPEKYRFGWLAFTRLSGCKSRVAKVLKQTAKKSGANISQWRISFDAIPSDDWISIEGFFDGQWKVLPQEMLAKIAEARPPEPV